VQKTQAQVNSGKVNKEDWSVGNCAEPNALNNLHSNGSIGLDGKIIYTFEFRKVKVNPNSPREWRIFYKQPCSYCETLQNEGVQMPQVSK
jgi:hypothetical protein